MTQRIQRAVTRSINRWVDPVVVGGIEPRVAHQRGHGVTPAAGPAARFERSAGGR